MRALYFQGSFSKPPASLRRGLPCRGSEEVPDDEEVFIFALVPKRGMKSSLSTWCRGNGPASRKNVLPTVVAGPPDILNLCATRDVLGVRPTSALALRCHGKQSLVLEPVSTFM